jgi:hypothetical protein
VSYGPRLFIKTLCQQLHTRNKIVNVTNIYLNTIYQYFYIYFSKYLFIKTLLILLSIIFRNKYSLELSYHFDYCVTHSRQNSVTYNKWMPGGTYFAEYDWTCRNQVGYLYGSVSKQTAKFTSRVLNAMLCVTKFMPVVTF